MNRLSNERQTQAVTALVEGMSINATCRMIGVAKNTVLKLLKHYGPKKLENQGHAVAPYLTHYNFCTVHKTLGVTSAMEAGITDHVWSCEEPIALLDMKQSQQVA